MVSSLPVLLLVLPLVQAQFSPDFFNFMVTFFGNAPFNDASIATKLMRADIPISTGVRGSFGGGNHTAGTPTTKQPVILVHGISTTAGRYDNHRLHLLAIGWDDSEVYATTYGSPNGVSPGTTNDNMQCDYIQRVRWLMQAVSAYTAQPVDVIGYSMGSPIARKAILGGACVENPSYNLGSPLTSSIDAYVSVVGANKGASLCGSIFSGIFKACNSIIGMKAGNSFYTNLNSAAHYEGSFVASIYSGDDEIVGVNCPNAANLCSPVPGSDKVHLVSGYHGPVIDSTAQMSFNLIYNHDATIIAP